MASWLHWFKRLQSMGTPRKIVGIYGKYICQGPYNPMIFLLHSWGSLFGVPILLLLLICCLMLLGFGFGAFALGLQIAKP